MSNINEVLMYGDLIGISKIEKVTGIKLDGYKLKIRIYRNDLEHSDILNIIAPENVVDEDIKEGDKIRAYGCLQSCTDFNNGRLFVFVYAQSVEITKSMEYQNIVYISGRVAKDVIYRQTPLGRRITEVFLKVPSELYNGYSYIPSIAWESGAKVAARLKQDDAIVFSGRLQSREYQKEIEGKIITRTTYELSTTKMRREESNES